MYLFKEEIFMYLFVFMYLFIYLPHDHYGNCNSELCSSAKENVRGGRQHYKRNERQCGRDKKKKGRTPADSREYLTQR